MVLVVSVVAQASFWGAFLLMQVIWTSVEGPTYRCNCAYKSRYWALTHVFLVSQATVLQKCPQREPILEHPDPVDLPQEVFCQVCRQQQ